MDSVFQMDKCFSILWILIITLILGICTTDGKPQQSTLFNQNLFNRPTQPFKPFNPQQTYQPIPRLLPQAYQAYNINQRFVPITAYQNEVSYDGTFAYGYAAGDGTTAQAQGYLKNAGRKDLEAQVVQGSYSYTSPEGTPIRVSYIADENGFRAEGAHLPTPPPIPDAIAKSLEYIARAQPLQQAYNQNLNPYQQQQYQQQQQLQRQNQLTPLQIQQQQFQLQQQQQQQSGQYQPQQSQYQPQQQRQFPQQFPQQFPSQQQVSTQQQQQQLQQQQQQQNLTQQLQARPNQIPTQYGYNKFRRFK